MNRPSRGERTSAATTRYVGCFFLPIRMRRSLTATRAFLTCSEDSEVEMRPLMLDCLAPSVQAGARTGVQTRQGERLLGHDRAGALGGDPATALALAALP